MQLLIERGAARRLRDLPQKRQLRMLEALEAIADNPYGEHANVKPLKGFANTFRYRLGDWQAVYVVDAAAQEVRVTRIGPRGEVYE
jgi:mRNA interferase RelE/StbE